MNQLIAGSLALLTALAMAGCQPRATNSAAAEEVVLGPEFSAKKGLLLPEGTRLSLGLKMADVTEQKIETTIAIQLRVYEVTQNASRASGAVRVEQAREFRTGESLLIRTREGQVVTGTITALNNQLQKATGMVEVLAEIPSASAQFAVGDFLQASKTLESGQNVITVPRSALLECSDGYSVYTVSGEHLVRTPVRVGAVNAELVEIKDGLYAGDQVVLQPVMSLWMTELAAVKGGQACCPAPPKGK